LRPELSESDIRNAVRKAEKDAQDTERNVSAD
jgi:hypothetical protein